MRNNLEFIRINQESLKPKYLQLAEAIVKGVATGRISGNSILPSLHECCTHLEISKKTVEKAYNALKERGIVGSYRGKGYYVK